MAKRVIWSKDAQENRKDILEYWNNRNKSRVYSRKLNQLFIEAVKLIAVYPEIGKLTEYKDVRIKIVRDYLVIYRAETNQIVILSIWDSRQNPEKLKSAF